MASPLLIFLFVSEVGRKAITVWPQPRSIAWPVPSATSLSPSLTIASPYHRYQSAAVNHSLHLIEAGNAYPLVTPKVNQTNGPSLQTLVITVNDLAAPLGHGVNESYSDLRIELSFARGEDILLDADIKVDASLLPPGKMAASFFWVSHHNAVIRALLPGLQACKFLGNNSQYDQAPFADEGNSGSWCGPFKTWQMIYSHL